MSEATFMTGVCPGIDGTWAAICPHCLLVVNPLEQSQERAQAFLDAHLRQYHATPVDLEALSGRLHDIYQKEAHRRGDVRHADSYADLSEDTKEWDRVLARWILEHFAPRFDPAERLPDA